MPDVSNPYVPPRTGSEPESAFDGAPERDARRRAWLTYASWLGVGTTLLCSGKTLNVGYGLSHFGGQEFMPSVQALSIVREHAGAMAGSAALFASVTFLHHHARDGARVRTPFLAIWPFFAATPAGYVVSLGIGFLVYALLDTTFYDIGRARFFEATLRYTKAGDLGVGLMGGCVDAAVLGVIASFALPSLQRAVPGHWQKIGVVWLVGLIIAIIGAIVKVVASLTG